jgi:hypothetical protein
MTPLSEPALVTRPCWPRPIRRSPQSGNRLHAAQLPRARNRTPATALSRSSAAARAPPSAAPRCRARSSRRIRPRASCSRHGGARQSQYRAIVVCDAAQRGVGRPRLAPYHSCKPCGNGDHLAILGIRFRKSKEKPEFIKRSAGPAAHEGHTQGKLLSCAQQKMEKNKDEMLHIYISFGQGRVDLSVQKSLVRLTELRAQASVHFLFF